MTAVSLRIANARGVPGCAGLLLAGGWLVTNYHVAFGRGARHGDPVWAIPPGAGIDVRETAVQIGVTHEGVIGRIGTGDSAVFVDCALIAMRRPPAAPAWVASALAWPWPRSAGRPMLADVVTKAGPATGQTHGRIVALDHFDQPTDGDTRRTASGQLLIASSVPARNFAAAGDSGAAVLGQDGRAVGLLWGVTGNAEGIASPINAVLAALGLNARAMAWEPV